VKIIIAGAGEVGFHIARRLSEENHDVVLIEKDPQHIKRVGENLDVQAFLGSGTSPRMLKEAGIHDADLLVAATDSDETNLIACLMARSLNPYLIKVARVRNEEYLQEGGLFSKELLGIDRVINPQAEMVNTIQSIMEIPGASEVIDFAGGRVKLIGFLVTGDSPFVDRKLLSLVEQRGKVLVGAIVHGEQVIIPRGEDIIRSGDLVYVIVNTSELNEALKFLGIRQETSRRVVIVGGGKTGTALAKKMDRTKINVKIIEEDSAKCANLSEMLDHVTVINGDGTDKHLLEEENIRGADFLVAVTGDEASNILMSLLAKGLGAKKTIARITRLSYLPLMSAIGIDTVVSARLSAAKAILQHIRPGKIISVAPLKGEHAEAIEAEALETSDIVNTPLSRVKIPKGAIVGAIIRGKSIIIPDGDSVILPKDRIIIFALQEVVPKLKKLLTVKLEYF
jgi:trk system potassium uptake protein